ncbi:MAG: glycosyltransferase family 2 protein, partial [Candidatus Rokuibacteriota bacterium]
MARTDATMQVRELIKDTEWAPGTGYGGARPRLSVLLPTFRRGADGTFLKAATSVLDQSERSLELIIVDDASTDGTADQIESLMRADGRVSCLRHRANIGLPAVSEYEALRRARAPYLAFAFDDFIFETDALGRLLEAAERRGAAVVHGIVELGDGFGQVGRLGERRVSCELLAFDNHLGNSGVVLARAVVDDVGFYDPHIAVVRLCDWDLWRRIAREYPIFREDVLVGRELGAGRPDSLGRTYPVYGEAVREYCNRRRNAELRPGAFEGVDVWAMPPAASACLAEHVLLMRRFFRSNAWAAGLDLRSPSDEDALLAPRGRCIGVLSEMTASTSLCFDGVLPRYQETLLFIPIVIEESALQLLVARCDAVILVRNLLGDRARQAALLCHSMDVPIHYLTDDNYILLRAEYPEFATYTRESVTQALEGFAGVLCTSHALAEYFRHLQLHPRIDEIGPVFDATKLAKLRRLPTAPAGPALRVGFVGGEFRLRSLKDEVLPALGTVAGDGPIEFFSWPLAMD